MGHVWGGTSKELVQSKGGHLTRLADPVRGHRIVSSRGFGLSSDGGWGGSCGSAGRGAARCWVAPSRFQPVVRTTADREDHRIRSAEREGPDLVVVGGIRVFDGEV
ncbi:hypothetical protein ZWY2020_049753 [Hordeum vulgare]|nr:hypothetical protein ZWY2020_049753 [Hordeum vulgare]